MKEIDISTKSKLKEYLSRPVEETHSTEELDSLYACIRYTHMFKAQESLDKMNEEELIERRLPDIGRF